MRGDERFQDELFSCVTLEQRVPQDHPLREIRKPVDAVLVSLNAEFACVVLGVWLSFDCTRVCAASAIVANFYLARSERQLVEQLDYNLLFRWFVGLSMDDAVWNRGVFEEPRRLLTSDVAQRIFAELNQLAKRFRSEEHFTVDGILIQGVEVLLELVDAGGWSAELLERSLELFSGRGGLLAGTHDTGIDQDVTDLAMLEQIGEDLVPNVRSPLRA